MSSLVPPLPPLAAAAAAIAIATASMDETDEEEDLNDLIPNKECLNADNSNHDNKTDAATADSAASINDHDSWQEYSDEEISVDVSMLSASNTTFTSFTGTTHQSNSKSKDTVGSSGLAAYMNRVKRESEESKKSKSKSTSLGAYMNWAKQHRQEKAEEVEDKSKKSTLDYSYKSFAEDTFDTFGTFGTFDTYESPKATQKTIVPVPLKACSDHHPVLNLSRRDPSIVPPSMPKRSVSNHEKIDFVPKTPKTRVTKTMSTTKSPSGDRVQRLLDADKRKCKYSRCNRRFSVPENFDVGTSTPQQQQRFPRRVSLDHATYSPESSVARRRASLDESLLSSEGTTTPPPSANNSCSKQQQQQLLQHPSLTPTITKTPRTSPSMIKSRKQLTNMEVQVAPDLQPSQKNSSKNEESHLNSEQ